MCDAFSSALKCIKTMILRRDQQLAREIHILNSSRLKLRRYIGNGNAVGLIKTQASVSNVYLHIMGNTVPDNKNIHPYSEIWRALPPI